MKGKGYMDLGTIFDEIFDAARDFSDEFHRNFNQFGGGLNGGGGDPRGRFDPRTFSPFGKNTFDENTDFYPNYSYPPMNVYMTQDRSLIFEFALAGFDEKDISLSFQGDYMVFSAKIPEGETADPGAGGINGGTGSIDGGARGIDGSGENLRYFKRRLKMKDIEKQKYFVPLDKYAQENVKAVYKNGILKVSIPPKDEPDQSDGIKIEIIKEGN
jgi:HSP20 family molecular chaperone IbpA